MAAQCNSVQIAEWAQQPGFLTLGHSLVTEQHRGMGLEKQLCAHHKHYGRGQELKEQMEVNPKRTYSS